jgi:hypothetical protein
MREAVLVVKHTWDGEPLPEPDHAHFTLRLDEAQLVVAVDAPFRDDPPPPSPPGPSDGLWEYEVAELFLLGDDRRYLELELGPHGHHLALELHGPRNVLRSGMPLEFTTTRNGPRWRGLARVPLAWLPRGQRATNAYTISGTGAERRYAAACPVPGPAPDFHRLDCFAALRMVR